MLTMEQKGLLWDTLKEYSAGIIRKNIGSGELIEIARNISEIMKEQEKMMEFMNDKKKESLKPDIGISKDETGFTCILFKGGVMTVLDLKGCSE